MNCDKQFSLPCLLLDDNNNNKTMSKMKIITSLINVSAKNSNYVETQKKNLTEEKLKALQKSCLVFHLLPPLSCNFNIQNKFLNYCNYLTLLKNNTWSSLCSVFVISSFQSENKTDHKNMIYKVQYPSLQSPIQCLLLVR